MVKNTGTTNRFLLAPPPRGRACDNFFFFSAPVNCCAVGTSLSGWAGGNYLPVTIWNHQFQPVRRPRSKCSSSWLNNYAKEPVSRKVSWNNVPDPPVVHKKNEMTNFQYFRITRCVNIRWESTAREANSDLDRILLVLFAVASFKEQRL